jgi:hypothetical protein
MGVVIEMVLESAIHLSREARICRGQPGRAGERLNRIQCADGVLIGMRTRRERVGRYGGGFPRSPCCDRPSHKLPSAHAFRHVEPVLFEITYASRACAITANSFL